MRDKRKDQKYFEAFISFQRTRIEQKESKLKECKDAGKAARINMSLLKYKIDLLIAEFSYGAKETELKDFLESAAKTAGGIKNVDYESLLVIFSLAVLMKDSKDIAAVIENNSVVIEKDKLLFCLEQKILNDDAVWEGKLTYPSVFGELNSIKDNSETTIQVYLENWYENHKSFSWYDSHNKTTDTYVGYWSFEAAALAQIFQVNDSSFRQNPYYPII